MRKNGLAICTVLLLSSAVTGCADPFADPARQVASVANRQGSLAVPLEDMSDVLAELAAGHTVMMGQGAALPPETVLGYNAATRQVSLVSVQGGHRWVAKAVLDDDWRISGRWAVAVLPPGDLPVHAERGDYVSAAGWLDQNGPAWEAVLAYDAGLALWPDDPDAFAGLGHSLWRLGDRDGAAKAFSRAVSLAGDAGDRQRIVELAQDTDPHLLAAQRGSRGEAAEKPLPVGQSQR